MFKDGVGRKFVACMVLQFFHVLLFASKIMPADSYIMLTMFIMGGYVSGNIAERIVEGKANVSSGKKAE